MFWGFLQFKSKAVLRFLQCAVISLIGCFWGQDKSRLSQYWIIWH